MFKFFKKKYIVTLKHLQFKTLVKNFFLDDKEDLKNFLLKCYSLNNFKTEIKINANDFSIDEICELHNINPFRENINIKDIIVSNSKEFLNKYNINEYTTEMNSVSKEYDFNANFVILLLDDNENIIEECHIPTYLDLKKLLSDMISSNINHLYTVNPSAITVKEYIDLLNLYSKFNPFEAFKTPYDINQYIVDCRNIDKLEPEFKSKEIIEIT